MKSDSIKLSKGDAEALVTLATTLAAERRLEVLLAAVTAAACQLTRAEGGRVMVLDRTGRHLHALVDRHETRDAAGAGEIAVYSEGNSFNMKDPNVFAAVTGKIVNVADIYSYSGFPISSSRLPKSNKYAILWDGRILYASTCTTNDQSNGNLKRCHENPSTSSRKCDTQPTQ